jgi:methylmalonyl-CoA mutase
MSDDASLSPLFDEFPAVSADEWDQKIREDLGGTAPEAVLRWESIDGITLSGAAREDDLAEVAHVSSTAPASPLADPSTPGNDWRIRHDLPLRDPDAALALARRALEGGCTDLGLPLPPPADADPGTAVAAETDLSPLLTALADEDAGLHLDRGPGSIVLARLLRREAAADPAPVRSVGYDPVAALATGAVGDANRAFALSDALLADPPPAARSLTVDLRPYHDAGASAVQALAYGLGSLSETLHQLLERGHALPDLVSQLQFQTAVSTSYFVEIAKLRALRLLVPQVLAAYADEAGTTIDDAPGDLVVQAETSRRTETIFDPYANMLRGTTEAMAAVLGGCDVLSVRPYDACFRSPDAFASRIARNVQLILKHEAHFDVVDDPAAGAYYLEQATHRLAQQAWHDFQSLETDGGALAALRSGQLQEDIGTVRRQRVAAVNDRDRVLVGTNHYPDLEETSSEDLEPAPCNNGSETAVEWSPSVLDALDRRLADDVPLPALLRAFADGPLEAPPLPRIRVAADVEAVRLRTEAVVDEGGRRPAVFLAPLGPAAARSARATFARNVFGVAGFAVDEAIKYESPTAAAAAAADAQPDVVVLCSADGEYPSLAPALRSALDAEGLSPLLVVAGAPDRMEGDVPADLFVHQGAPLRDFLTTVQDRLELPPLDAA